MWDNVEFDPEKISIVEFKLLNGQVNAPEEFDVENIEGHHLDYSLDMGFNVKDKLAKVDFTVDIKAEGKDSNEVNATGNFHFVFIYKVENLSELTIFNSNKMIDVEPRLAASLASITYSTARGILLTRLQGTALQNFILPVISTNKLVKAK